MFTIENLKIKYLDIKERGIEHKYFPPQMVENILLRKKYNPESIGKSFEGKQIHLLTKGKGTEKVLLWSQMHGNESTAARAMFDVWNFLEDENEFSQKIKQELSIDWIPQLNPDGAERYTRRNAMGIDINRDFNAEQSPEIKVLKNQVKSKNYDCLFNLHDQRSIFHPQNQKNPATLSFLSPSVDRNNTETPQREKTKKVIAYIYEYLQPKLGQIARFDHDFYPKATGDNFQKLGYPTILIECGHFVGDWERNKTREYCFYALVLALYALATKAYNKNDYTKLYEQIPQNDNKALDIIYRNVQLKNNTHSVTLDIGIYIENILQDGNLKSVAKIQEVGDLDDYFAYNEIDAKNEIFSNHQDSFPKIGNLANFDLGKTSVKNGMMI